MCFLSPFLDKCFDSGFVYQSGVIASVPNTLSPSACLAECKVNVNCFFFSYYADTKMCALSKSNVKTTTVANVASGTVLC